MKAGIKYSITTIALSLLVIGFLFRGIVAGVLAYYGFSVRTSTPTELRELLEPYYIWYEAERSSADLQTPGVLLVPGCLGTQAFHEHWGQRLASSGITALLVDSFSSRGIDSLPRLKGICEGEELWGFERASDVLIALDALRKNPAVDAGNLSLLGWSHGGWSVMDAAALSGHGATPPFLSEDNQLSLAGVGHVFALYPYCGFGSFSSRLGWVDDIQGHVFLATNDQNIEPGPCREFVASQNASSTLNVNISVQEFNSDHWFDNPEGFDLVEHNYDPVAAEAVAQSIFNAILGAQD